MVKICFESVKIQSVYGIELGDGEYDITIILPRTFQKQTLPFEWEISNMQLKDLQRNGECIHIQVIPNTEGINIACKEKCTANISVNTCIRKNGIQHVHFQVVRDQNIPVYL